MAAAMATMAILNAKCTKTQIPISTTKQSSKPISPISIPCLPPTKPLTLTATSTALAGAVFATLGSSDPAFAAQQLAQLAAEAGSNDNRGIALLLPLIPAIAWVLFNILQPALNQINRMRQTKGLAVGLGIGAGLAAAGLAGAPEASAAAVEEIARIAAAAEGSDSRGQLLLIVVAPAILWVLYNILQPALNQINRMRS